MISEGPFGNAAEPIAERKIERTFNMDFLDDSQEKYKETLHNLTQDIDLLERETRRLKQKESPLSQREQGQLKLCEEYLGCLYRSLKDVNEVITKIESLRALLKAQVAG